MSLKYQTVTVDSKNQTKQIPIKQIIIPYRLMIIQKLIEIKTPLVTVTRQGVSGPIQWLQTRVMAATGTMGKAS